MRNLLLVIVIGLAAYGGYTIWNNQRLAPEKLADAKTEEPVPAEKPAEKPSATITPEPQIPKQVEAQPTPE